jgi:anti-anti-sigma factor
VSGQLARLELERHGATTLARLSGEIDLSNAESLQSEILDAAAPSSVLVIDLGGVEYMDSSAVLLLERTARRLSALGRELRIVVPNGSVAADVLGLVGMTEVIAVYDSASAAVDG